jgi:pilus assembly protein CpaE
MQQRRPSGGPLPGHRRGLRRLGDDSGQASVELVAVLPALGLALLAAIQLALVGYALWSAGAAARTGARAAHVGGDAASAARSALPAGLREAARISGGEDEPVRVTIRAPSLVPGLSGIPVGARTELGPGDG